MISKLSVTLAADKNAIDPAVQAIMQLVLQMPSSAGKEPAVELALTEALANAVVHGAKLDPSKQIECDITCDDVHGLVIVVRDPGTGFNPQEVPDPLYEQNLLSNHGRGIYLINQLMDEVKFLKNGTEIHMRKK
ncbi:MAG TPA: ATP-binding protein [Terriglobales bacterium]|nr:ATP-binding protein [Terriglobales bacterium]